MKTLIFSDSHLTETFEQDKFDFLKRIISQSDHVIINGDFWDGFITTFDSFINSQWQELFPLLKEKNAVYLEGNHDSFDKSDERVNQFSIQQGTEYVVPWKGKIIHIEHGHKSDPLFGSTHYVPLFSPILLVYDFFDHYGVNKFGRWFRYLFWPKWIASFLVRLKVSKLPMNTILLVGHTHWAHFDLDKRFINLDAIKYGYGSYVIVDDKDEISFFEERYG